MSENAEHWGVEGPVESPHFYVQYLNKNIYNKYIYMEKTVNSFLNLEAIKQLIKKCKTEIKRIKEYQRKLDKRYKNVNL